MDGNHPKRRKDKYNPYTIVEKGGWYFLSFKDGQAVRQIWRYKRNCLIC